MAGARFEDRAGTGEANGLLRGHMLYRAALAIRSRDEDRGLMHTCPSQHVAAVCVERSVRNGGRLCSEMSR